MKFFTAYKLLFILLFAVSCKKSVSTEEQIINDVFLDLVSTQGYCGGSLIPPPAGNEPTVIYDNRYVEVEKTMQPISAWKKHPIIF